MVRCWKSGRSGTPDAECPARGEHPAGRELVRALGRRVVRALVVVALALPVLTLAACASDGDPERRVADAPAEPVTARALADTLDLRAPRTPDGAVLLEPSRAPAHRALPRHARHDGARCPVRDP